MRTIKFRAWDTIDKKWLFGYEMPNLGGFNLIGEVTLMGELNSISLERWNDVSIMQFTGLLDKKGKEIYEGDIVLAKHWNPSKFKIEFIEGAFCGTFTGCRMPTDINHFYDSTGCAIEIIGNVHQTPELI